MTTSKSTRSPQFIDVFAGCGGLSLGLVNAGYQGLFTVEKSSLAFETLKHNLVDRKKGSFAWPKWLPQEAMTCEDLLDKYSNQIGRLSGQVELLVGGPPCQGFSTAGKRDPADPRNKMTEQYLALVGLIKPRFLVIENVAGYNMKFDQVSDNSTHKPYAQIIASRLDALGYHVYAGLINCADFGVPQNRLRFVIICEKKDSQRKPEDLMKKLLAGRQDFLKKRGLPAKHVTVEDAISDLVITGRRLIPCSDSDPAGFNEAEYQPPKKYSSFQTLMRTGAGSTAPNSRRLANHKASTIEYFKLVMSICRPGYSLSVAERKKVGTKKHSTTVLNGGLPAPTVTTLPDDIVHYKEPRILTVRENARLQSFPDWFEFRGKYTTGGKQRKHECPRYTQVGNAVPPLLSEAIGEVLLARMAELARKQKRKKSPSAANRAPKMLSESGVPT